MKTRLIFLSLVISFLVVNQANGQKNILKADVNQYMVYSQGLGDSYAHWYLIYNNEYRISASFSKIYLLNKQNIRIDSMEVSSNENRNPINLLEVVDNSIIGHTMQKSFNLKVVDDKLKTVNLLDYKNISKDWKDYNHFFFSDEENFLGYSRSIKKNQEIKVKSSGSLQEVKLGCQILNSQDPTVQLAGSFLHISKDFAIFNLPHCVKSYGFNPSNGELIFTYDSPLEAAEFKFLTYDQNSKKLYSVNKRDTKYYILELNEKYLPAKLVAISDFQPMKIHNEKVHVIFGFEGVFSHALVPLDENESIPFVDFK
jgi:hypothetical protein